MVSPAGAQPDLEEVIVVLEPTSSAVADVAEQIARAHSGQVGFVYSDALQGFTLTAPSEAIEGLIHNPQVRYVEPVREVSVAGTQPIPEGIDRVDGDLNPPAGPMDVDIAILDTGVYIGTNPDGSSRSHLDLNLRYVTDCTAAVFYPLFGGCSGSGNFQDENGHGTHVAGITGAKDNDIGSIGTAPGATLWSVKVLNSDGTGTTGMLLAGIDFTAANADRIEVANMSLTFQGTSQAIDDGIAGATDAGVVFVVAAGNGSSLASGYSPGNGPDVITVSALADFDGLPGGLGTPTCRSDVDDTLADFSNFGPDVEIAAPGVCIFSTYLNDGYTTFSGTSMASPFVAGAVARYIAESGLDPSNRADVEAIRGAIVGAGMPQASACGFVDVDSDPEPLLFVNGPMFGGDGTCGGTGAPVNNPPVVDFTWTCTDLACSFDATASDADNDPLTYAWDFGDTGSSSLDDPAHTYSAGGDYDVTLTVDDGTDPASVTNTPPVVDFTWTCTDLACSFDATATDDDNDPLAYAWDFGDTGSSLLDDPDHTYGSGGDYDVTLTVDDGTDPASVAHTVSVTAPTATPNATAAVLPILVDGRNASVIVSVTDATSGIAGATVEGEWAYLDRRGRIKTSSASGVSDSNGEVSFVKKLPRNYSGLSFCLTSVSIPGYNYVESVTCGYLLDP
jgi:subtilisin family serine protease